MLCDCWPSERLDSPTRLERCKNKTFGTVNPARKSIFLHPFPHIIQTKLTDLITKLCLYYLGNDVWKKQEWKNKLLHWSHNIFLFTGWAGGYRGVIRRPDKILCPAFRQSYIWHLICPENLFYLRLDCSNKHFKMKSKLFSPFYSYRLLWNKTNHNLNHTRLDSNFGCLHV